MIRRIAVLAVVFLAWRGGVAAAQPTPRDLGPVVAKLCRARPSVELVTMGIGSLIWERHGHIALCVCGEDPRADACYNYGIGDFHEPVKMGWGFFRGAKSFWVGKLSPADMLWVYVYFDRSIWVQVLPLDADQRGKVVAKLEHDILDDNRYYAYDHFEDNCTTRIRDILDDVTDHKLSKMTESTDGKTFRDLARDGFFGMRLPLIITDIAMGRSTDRVPTYWERMFLPQYLREAVEKGFGATAIPIYERKGPPAMSDGPSGRVWLALIAILLTAPVLLARRFGYLRRTALAVALAPQVLLGLVLWFLAIISPLPYVHLNESCLVFLPLDLLLLFLPEPRRVAYARGRVAMLALMAVLMLVNVLKQPLFAELLFPLIPALAVGFWRPEWTLSRAKPAPAPRTKATARA